MSITERINQDMKEAMKAKDKERLAVIRMIKAALQKESIEKKGDLSPEEELTIVARELKQRKDSIAEFEKAGREDLVEKTVAEVAIVEQYLPKQLSQEETVAAVQAIIDELGATSAKEFGKVMGVAMARLKGQVDGNVVKDVTKSLLP